jgi:hypothetical protein
VHRIDQLREAVQDYGLTTIETNKLLTQFGRDVIKALSHYLHREKQLVHGVPPHDDDWKTDTDYRDAAFSSHGQPYLTLDPVDLGVAVRIDNLDDKGALWVRIVLTMQRVGDEIHLLIDDLADLRVPVKYHPKLEEVCELIFDTILKIYTRDVEHVKQGFYSPKSAIGFRVSAQD